MMSTNRRIRLIELENYSHSTRIDAHHTESTKMQSTIQFLQKAATFMNMLAVAVKSSDEAELLCRMLAESNVREEYVLQEDEDGCTVAVQSFAAAWNMVETKLMNGELVFVL